jgi:hypothetical protein
MQDPHIPDPTLHHHAIFVVTHPNGSGYQHDVTGDITSITGMTYQKRFRSRVKEDLMYASEETLGYVLFTTLPQFGRRN